eukprot:GHUV01048466.1.p1 GENE.GHUV01048466.1~~GHUV01048466.1.p1  ORF type:complete len:179 (+),score=33.36 GHUV01048466.1:196-732(+)
MHRVAPQAPQIEYVKVFTRRQHELGIYGTVGEIGVHHGKFLIPILGNALASEPAIAMDLFEDQESNLAKSGFGSKLELLRNLEACGIPENSIRLAGGNSMHLTASNFTQWGLPAFRLLSVDGGHSLEITLHDLMVASCVPLPASCHRQLNDLSQEWRMLELVCGPVLATSPGSASDHS